MRCDIPPHARWDSTAGAHAFGARRKHYKNIARFCDRLKTPAPRPAEVSNNPWQESMSAWLLGRMFFDTTPSAELLKATPSAFSVPAGVFGLYGGRWIVRGTHRLNIWLARVRMGVARVGSTSILKYPRLTSAAIRVWLVSALAADSLTGKAPAKASVRRIDGTAGRTRVVMATPQAHPPPG
jgi:hypothetical protein